ncbi:hypothetical protein L1887_57716 [Cichorium endivia]|nr:hypothetical protein L1887_57716 [Cichorium endivia]
MNARKSSLKNGQVVTSGEAEGRASGSAADMHAWGSDVPSVLSRGHGAEQILAASQPLAVHEVRGFSLRPPLAVLPSIARAAQPFGVPADCILQLALALSHVTADSDSNHPDASERSNNVEPSDSHSHRKPSGCSELQCLDTHSQGVRERGCGDIQRACAPTLRCRGRRARARRLLRNLVPALQTALPRPQKGRHPERSRGQASRSGNHRCRPTPRHRPTVQSSFPIPPDGVKRKRIADTVVACRSRLCLPSSQ